jgi:hypothetical protein
MLQPAIVSSLAAPNVKGLAFRTVMSMVAVHCGREVQGRALERMPPEVAMPLREGYLLATGWYPIDWYKGMWRAILDASGEGTELARRIGRSALLEDISSVYRHLLRLLSPGTVTSIGAKYFNRFYDTGGFRVVATEPRKLAVRFEGCNGFDHTMWIEVFGSIEAFIELSGEKGVTVHATAGAGDGEDWAEVVARWR